MEHTNVLSCELAKELRTFLKQFNNLRDFDQFIDGFHSRLSNNDLEWFRNHPKEPYREVQKPHFKFPVKIRRPNELPLWKLTTHIESCRKDTTIWISNSAAHDQIMMLADIDAKHGETDADAASQYLSQKWLGGRTYIEPSTSGKGRHVYFILDCEFVKRADVVEDWKQFSDIVATDLKSAGFGAALDGFYGLPTLWDRDGDAGWKLAYRGNLLRVPYLHDGSSDLNRLRSLVPLSHEALRRFLPLTATPTTMLKGDMGRTPIINPKTGVSDNNEPSPQSGWERKLNCVSRMIRRTNGECTVDQCLSEYTQNYHPTGMSAADIQKRTNELTSILKHFTRSFIPAERQTPAHPFQKDEFLELTTRLVPDSEFVWDRREKLDHERLADFLSVKVQDAFFQKTNEYFGSASRDATLANFRALKEKGMVNWICTPNQYTRLLNIAVKYELLTIASDYIKPVRMGGTKIKGVARCIGPGEALRREHNQWKELYEAWKQKHASERKTA